MQALTYTRVALRLAYFFSVFAVVGCSGLTSTSSVPQSSSNKDAAAGRIVAASVAHSASPLDCAQPLSGDCSDDGGDGGDSGDGDDGGDDGSDGGDSDDGGSDDSDDGGSDDSDDGSSDSPGSDDVDGNDDYDLTDDADVTMLDNSTTQPNTSLLPAGSYNVNGQWYNSYGEPLTWCADCDDGTGSWLAQIGSATAQSNNITFQYASNDPNPPVPNSKNDWYVSVICALTPGCKNVPVIFNTSHGSRQRANDPWPTNLNQHQLQNAIMNNLLLQEFSGKIYPGMPRGTQFTFSFDGITVGYNVTWFGTLASPGPFIFVGNYYPLRTP